MFCFVYFILSILELDDFMVLLDQRQVKKQPQCIGYKGV